MYPFGSDPDVQQVVGPHVMWTNVKHWWRLFCKINKHRIKRLYVLRVGFFIGGNKGATTLPPHIIIV